MEFKIRYKGENDAWIVSPVFHIRDVMQIKTMALSTAQPQGQLITEFLVHDIEGNFVFINSVLCQYQGGETRTEDVDRIHKSLEDIRVELSIANQ